MQKVFLSLCLAGSMMLAGLNAGAQSLQLPAPSPKGVITQTIGLTDVTVEYSRPSVKGRVIWGDLVPYNEMWRTGANAATTINFTDDVMIEGQKLPKGKYSLFTIPTATEWTIIFNKNPNLGGTSGYKQEEDALRIKVKPVTSAEMVETFTINIADVTSNSAILQLAWEKLRIPVKIEVDTKAKAASNIKSATDNTWRTYAQSANYYLQNDDIASATSMIDKSIMLKETYYNYYVKAQILAKSGKYNEALAMAQKAKTIGDQTPDEGYTNFWKGQIDNAITEYTGKATPSKKK
ncbi:MAG: DUF2911 domain-containing protein [Bacteroidota bacterium]|nr:DUF2911 domain-containing protein [Bacteroidota bacterium]